MERRETSVTEIEKVKDSIAKLLALAGSPNENEARTALLKARELMARHKLREADVKRPEDLKVVKRQTGITCTKATNSWAVELSVIIAEHYCCRSYREHVKGAKKIVIGLVGLDDDIDVCERILLYAFDCAVDGCKKIKRRNGDSYSAAAVRQMQNAYGSGFCVGLRKAYREQDARHQAYGLILVVPQAVNEATDKLGRAEVFAKADCDGYRMRFAQLGYQDGQRFDPSTKLSGKEGL
jgi:hypothetical protein